MYVWSGSTWAEISSSADIIAYKYTATAGATSVSGADDNSLTLSYTVGKEQVYINGVLQVRGSDYTASTGSSITGMAALTASDIVTVLAFTAFSVANTVPLSTYTAKGAVAIGTGASTVGTLAVGSNGDTLVADSSTSTGLRYQGNFAAGKNKIYNASMLIAQRGTSFTGISGTTAVYTVDRWSVSPQNLGTVTATQDTTIPTGAGVGQSLKLACTTADASPSANTRLRLIHRLEGFDVQDLNYGTASAKPLTLSFWVQSSKTGTYIVEFWTRQTSSEKNISTTYTITTANTWQQVKITIPGDTVSNIANDNGSRFDVYFWLASGSDYTSGTLNTSWNTPVTANRAVGQVNWADSATATFYMTAVQLEIGSVATAFQTMTGTIQGELAACQRYYWRTSYDATYAHLGSGIANSTTALKLIVPLPVQLRTPPSSFDWAGSSGLMATDGVNNLFITAIAGDSGYTTRNIIYLNCTFSGATQFRSYQVTLGGAGNSTQYLGCSAEL
jgi:hypothetical protein